MHFKRESASSPIAIQDKLSIELQLILELLFPLSLVFHLCLVGSSQFCHLLLYLDLFF